MRRVRGACCEDDAARFAVKTGNGAENVGTVAVAVGKSVGERIVKMPVRGMRGHIARLETDGDLVILV